MREFIRTITDEEAKQQNACARLVSKTEEISLMTLIGVVEGELLTRIENEGQVRFRALIRDTIWASHLVVMAIGSLIREGLICALQKEDCILLRSKTVDNLI